MITFEEYLSKIIDHYTSKEYEPELLKAKKEFFGFIGSVHEEDPFFESYMTAFIEWYIFTRDMTNKDLPPIRLFYRDHTQALSPEEKSIYEDFTKFRHSIFITKKVKPSLLVIHDLYANEKITIEHHFPAAGFNTGDIFEAILVPFRGQLTFTKTFFFHPQEVKRFVVRELKKVRQLEQKILLKVILRFRRLRLKYDRYPHVPPAQIYTEEEFNKYA